MFDLADKPLVWIPVKWPGVAGDGENLASNVTHEIECQVELVDTQGLVLIMADYDAELDPEAKAKEELARFRKLVHDWRKVKMGRTSAPMTDENILRMLRVPNFSAGFERSYIAAWSGRLEEREKNLSSSSSDGRADEDPAENKTE